LGKKQRTDPRRVTEAWRKPLLERELRGILGKVSRTIDPEDNSEGAFRTL